MFGQGTACLKISCTLVKGLIKTRPATLYLHAAKSNQEKKALSNTRSISGVSRVHVGNQGRACCIYTEKHWWVRSRLIIITRSFVLFQLLNPSIPKATLENQLLECSEGARRRLGNVKLRMFKSHFQNKNIENDARTHTHNTI